MLNYFKEEDDLAPMDPIEAEVDAIRRQLWDEIKDMTIEEHLAYFSRETADVRKQFNIKQAASIHEDYASL